jgi:hypothetical protein
MNPKKTCEFPAIGRVTSAMRRVVRGHTKARAFLRSVCPVTPTPPEAKEAAVHRATLMTCGRPSKRPKRSPKKQPEQGCKADGHGPARHAVLVSLLAQRSAPLPWLPPGKQTDRQHLLNQVWRRVDAELLWPRRAFRPTARRRRAKDEKATSNGRQGAHPRRPRPRG